MEILWKLCRICVAAVVITFLMQCYIRDYQMKTSVEKERCSWNYFRVICRILVLSTLSNFYDGVFSQKYLTPLTIFANKLHHRSFTMSYKGSLLINILTFIGDMKRYLPKLISFKFFGSSIDEKPLRKNRKIQQKPFNKPNKFKSVSFEILEFFSSIHHQV